ncbi:hypothetical protein GCM10011504_56990 [Siccirubricoccus deserti]|nr:hypothetical protein GCM10011504_56990 [Siccirubricoccus deserti]
MPQSNSVRLWWTVRVRFSIASRSCQWHTAGTGQPAKVPAGQHDRQRTLEFLEPAKDGVVAVTERDEGIEVGGDPGLGWPIARARVGIEPALEPQEAQPAAIAVLVLLKSSR